MFNIFLQILDDGVLTDGKGRTVDFKNTIIILTSNLGAEHLAMGMAGENTMEAARDIVMEQVSKYFKPEFLNRLTEVVIFEPLSRDMLKEVVKVQMKSIVAGVSDKGISLSTTDAALDVILEESYNPMYGARPIRRWVQKNVMTKLSEMLIQGEVDEGSTVSIDATDDKKALKYEVAKKVKTKKIVPVQDGRHALEAPSSSNNDMAEDDGHTMDTANNSGDQAAAEMVPARGGYRTESWCNCNWCDGHWYHCQLSCRRAICPDRQYF